MRKSPRNNLLINLFLSENSMAATDCTKRNGIILNASTKQRRIATERNSPKKKKESTDIRCRTPLDLQFKV